ncbi:MAG: hypothetical protein LBU32_27720 [Clostridiales bacterium]|jgi:formate hydrogenlyase subunit 3/multisubunit Na+/H+ antiporter MnhD subunit|nr:hypothetical protein [Clostridiales bacterium]
MSNTSSKISRRSSTSKKLIFAFLFLLACILIAGIYLSGGFTKKTRVFKATFVLEEEAPVRNSSEAVFA